MANMCSPRLRIKVVQDRGGGHLVSDRGNQTTRSCTHLTAAHYILITSAFRRDRKQIKANFDSHFSLREWAGSPEERMMFLEDLCKAFYVAFLTFSSQRINIIDQADQENGWINSFPDVFLISHHGCIIRTDYILYRRLPQKLHTARESRSRAT